MNQNYILIQGPTGVGKTDTVDQIGLHLPIEIVNCDVGQFYEPFSIGTAKPDWRSNNIPHHLFDIVQHPEHFSVVKYRHLIVSTMDKIWQRGKTPVLVGGSGFYGKSLFFPPQTMPSETEPEDSDSWDYVYQHDPERAASIDKNDRYRIARAAALIKQGVTIPSQHVPQFDPPPGDCLVLFLRRDRADLYEKINMRTDYLFNHGWIEEVQTIQGTAWENFLEQKKLIGYAEILQFLKNDDPLTDDTKRALVDVIARKTRNYAKRQETFWRMFKASLEPHFKNSRSQIAEINLSKGNGVEQVKLLLEAFLDKKEKRI